MKLTACLRRHNLYRMMGNQWKSLRKRRLLTSPAAEKAMKQLNLEVIDANEFVAEPKPYFDFNTIVGLAPKELPKDENHPQYKEQPCYMYRDNTVLLEGMLQALAVTNTVQLESNTLPPQILGLLDKSGLPNQDELVKRCIKTSCMFDAEQKKLPKRKDPERPAWNFPRDYGITEFRKNRMLCNRLLHLCALASPTVSTSRTALSNVLMSVPFTWADDNVQFELRADVFLCSDKPLPPIVSPAEVAGQTAEELSISHPLISFEEENFYELKNIFPLKQDARRNRVHTIVVHYNETEVKNLFDSPVTTDQTVSRSLLKAYTAAVAQARYTYGLEVQDVPEPVVVQCVQTNGRWFHFCVLQLNSADVQSRRPNVFWSIPPQDLYDVCAYVDGTPVFEGYNPQVFKHLLAFYNNS